MLEKFAEWAMARTYDAIALFLALGGALTALAFAARNVAGALREWRRKRTNGEHTAELRKDLEALSPRQINSDPLRLVTYGELREAIQGVREEIRSVIRELTESRERLAVKVEALPGEIKEQFAAVLEGWLEDSERRSLEMRAQLAEVLAAHGIIERRKVNEPVAVERRARGKDD